MHRSFEFLRHVLNAAKTVEELFASENLPGILSDPLRGRRLEDDLAEITDVETNSFECRLNLTASVFTETEWCTEKDRTIETAQLLVSLNAHACDTGIFVAFDADVPEGAWTTYLADGSPSTPDHFRLVDLAKRLGIDTERQVVTESAALELIGALIGFVKPHLG